MMIRPVSSRALALQFVVDLVLTVVAVKLAELVRLHIHTGWERRGEVFVSIAPWVYGLVFLVWTIFFVLFGVFDPDRRRSLVVDLGSVWLAITVAMLSLASLFYLLAPDPASTPSRLFYLYLYLIDLALLGLAHAVLHGALLFLRRRGRHVRRVLLVGAGVHGRHVAVRLRGRETAGIVVVGYVSQTPEEEIPGLTRLGGSDCVTEIVTQHRVSEVVLALPADAHVDALRISSMLRDSGVCVRILPDVFELTAMKARVEDFFGLPLISITEPSINPVQARIKRAFDLVLSLTLLLVLSPLMLAIALWVRFDSPGPVIIHQKRIGAGGKPFFMHKFRSMTWNPDQLDSGFAKRRGDPRVTHAGRFLRRTSLDELAQLWNVVTGEMSLVGPRPELPSIVDLYEPWQRKRFLVPPGMTGWWQVNGRSERSMHLNTEIDLYYVQNYSILLDLEILARTVGAVIKGRGAY